MTMMTITIMTTGVTTIITTMTIMTMITAVTTIITIMTTMTTLMTAAADMITSMITTIIMQMMCLQAGAKRLFTSIQKKKLDYLLKALSETAAYGTILRSKGIIQMTDG